MTPSIAALYRPDLQGNCPQTQCDQHRDQRRDRGHILWFVAVYSLALSRGKADPMRNKRISNDREIASTNVATVCAIC